MSKERSDDRKTKMKGPWLFELGRWYNYILSAILILYGTVMIILGFLDRNYAGLSEYIIYTIVGVILVSFAIAYGELRKWGWYGLIGMNALVMVLGLLGLGGQDGLLFGIALGLVLVTLSALVALFSSPTRDHLSGRC